MKKRLLIITAALLALVLILVSCQRGSGDGTDSGAAPSGDAVDYAASVTLDPGSGTLRSEVTVKTYVDGDTTHFNIPENVYETGLLKARYIAVNTPESTGKVEEWGKKASNFTKEKLSGAESIVVESDTANWDIDSTGTRCLVWVWYKPAGGDAYRNLNFELLQNGLAIASSSANNRYGSVCMQAIDQAKAQKLNIYSGQKDPDFFYGDAREITLAELRINTESYNAQKVAFEGVVVLNNNNGVYVEEFDPENGLYNGIYVYYGFGLSGEGLQILSVGNRVRIVGTVQYYEAGGTWQVSGLTYRQMKPNDPGNIQKLGEGFSGAFVEIDPSQFASGKVTVTVGEDEKKEFDYAALILNSSVSAKSLKVKSIYTTNNETSSSNGAMTLTCEAADGTKVSVRTVVLYDADNRLITADRYEGKTIDVRGIVDYYSGDYQIKVFSDSDITIH